MRELGGILLVTSNSRARGEPGLRREGKKEGRKTSRARTRTRSREESREESMEMNRERSRRAAEKGKRWKHQSGQVIGRQAWGR